MEIRGLTSRMAKTLRPTKLQCLLGCYCRQTFEERRWVWRSSIVKLRLKVSVLVPTVIDQPVGRRLKLSM